MFPDILCSLCSRLLDLFLHTSIHPSFILSSVRDFSLPFLLPLLSLTSMIYEASGCDAFKITMREKDELGNEDFGRVLPFENVD